MPQIELSPEHFSLGVEEEYQVIDAETGALRSAARQMLDWDWTGDLQPEMQQNTVEVGTPVCRNAAEARAHLERLRLQSAVAARSQGCRIVAAGTHPFSHWNGQEFTDRPVYHAIHDEYRRLAESQNIFGMHVHVATPPGVDRVRVMNTARLYLPYLLAITASSPLFLGDDTGHESYRLILWHRWPRTGAPHRFADAAEFEQLLRWLIDTRRMDAPGRLYWDMRPHHLYPTLEFRVTDVTPRLDDAIAAAALARAVVAGVVSGTLREPELPDSTVQTMLGENVYRAARDGRDADFVDLGSGTPRVVEARAAVQELVDRLAGIAEQLGDMEVVGGIPGLLEDEGAASRIRQVREQQGDLRSVALWLAGETTLGLGMDRRTEQRTPTEAA